MPIVHLVARLLPPYRHLGVYEHARWFWDCMREAYPRTLSAALMPNHPHCLADVACVERAHRQMRSIAGHFRERLGERRPIWEEIPAPKVFAERDKIQLQARYVGLNAPRKGLCKDPLSWPWSTHRDVVGAVVDPWVDPDDLARWLGRPREDFPRWYHDFVSRDRSVAIAGTPLPRPPGPHELMTFPLETIAAAAAAAVRRQPDGIVTDPKARQLFLHLAHEEGWHVIARLAVAAGVTPRAVRYALDRPAPGLEAARLCLGDRRLRNAFRPIGADHPAYVPSREPLHTFDEPM